MLRTPPVGRKLRRASALVVMAWLGVFAWASAAQAAATSVTLQLSRAAVPFGGTVSLTGEVDPPVAGQIVTIHDADTLEPLGQDETDVTGSYKVVLKPHHSIRVRAESAPAISGVKKIGVRPVIALDMTKVRLFDVVKARGTLKPAHDNARIQVTLFRGDTVVARAKAPLRDGTRFAARFRIGRPGVYHVKAAFSHVDHLTARRRTTPQQTPLPNLEEGADKRYVELLEGRLRQLRYYLPGVDRSFDVFTGDAVTAFNKVEGRERLRTVDASTWRALAKASRPKPRSTSPEHHVEIDQTRQVLFLIKRGKVSAVLHTSTGAGGATRDGTFHVHRKIYGYSPGRLYYPSYFDGNRAVHGWSPVPTYNASHGCSRVPMHTAIWISDRMPIGTEVQVYH